MSVPYPLAEGWDIAVDSDGRWAVSQRGFTYVDFDTEALALAWYAGFMYAQRVKR